MCSTFWVDLPQPTSGEGADTTFNAQSTYIFPFRFPDGSKLLLWMGDRWNAGGPGSVGAATYVFLPLLPRLGAPGFQLVDAPGGAWSLATYKGAAFDPGQQRVVFAAELAARRRADRVASQPGHTIDR